MKNDMFRTRNEDRYFLNTTTLIGTGVVGHIKSLLNNLKRSKRKAPFFSDAVSKGILDFFEELGYGNDRKI
jgi:hypothetical protein